MIEALALTGVVGAVSLALAYVITKTTWARRTEIYIRNGDSEAEVEAPTSLEAIEVLKNITLDKIDTE